MLGAVLSFIIYLGNYFIFIQENTDNPVIDLNSGVERFSTASLASTSFLSTAVESLEL